LFCADGVSLLGENINVLKKNTEALLDDSKKVHLEVNEDEAILYSGCVGADIRKHWPGRNI
jgi:hypothetical protein